MKKILISLIVVSFIFSGCSFKKDSSVLDTGKKKVIPPSNVITKSSFSVIGDNTDKEKANKVKVATDDWKEYVNNKAGISFKYPDVVSFDGSGNFQLNVDVKKIEELNGTMGFDKDTALNNRESLKAGKYGVDVDWPLTESKKIVKVGNSNAQEFMVLSRFEICDIVFERKLYFFNSDYQIVVTLKIPQKVVLKEASRYFKFNKASCGKDKVWDFKLQKEFFNDLSNGKGSKKAQIWFNSFEGIIDTINLKKVKNNIKQLQGKWQSDKDEKTVLEFKDNIRINLQDNKKKEEGAFKLYASYPIVDGVDEKVDGVFLIVDDGDDNSFDYKILKLDSSKLELIYLPTGNKLSYSKIK